MIGRLSGVVVEKRGDVVILDVQGVGYLVHLSLQSMSRLPAEGGRAQLRCHLLGANKLLARQVPAALGHDLVFQMDARGARFLEEPHRAFDVQRFAETRVGVAQQRQRCGPRQRARVLDELGIHTGAKAIGRKQLEDERQLRAVTNVPERNRAAGMP